jgi:hypothetical protein
LKHYNTPAIIKTFSAIDFVKSLLNLKKAEVENQLQHTDSTVFVKPEQEKALLLCPAEVDQRTTLDSLY